MTFTLHNTYKNNRQEMQSQELRLNSGEPQTRRILQSILLLKLGESSNLIFYSNSIISSFPSTKIASS